MIPSTPAKKNTVPESILKKRKTSEKLRAQREVNEREARKVCTSFICQALYFPIQTTERKKWKGYDEINNLLRTKT